MNNFIYCNPVFNNLWINNNDEVVNEQTSEFNLFTKRPMGFYLHIPFCKNVCVSCPYQKERPKQQIMNKYVDILKTEISNYANRPHIKAAEFEVGHIGGGTPTSFDTEQLVDILQHLTASFNFSKGFEITIETTPIDLTEEKAEKLLQNGIGRISIGVQSFNNDELVYIGRNYDRDAIVKTIKMLQRLGLEKLNIDLMYGMPGQTFESWSESLQMAVDLGVNSISFYNYILIESPLAVIRSIQGKIPEMPDEDMRDKMFYHAAEILTQHGYEGYYADAFTKPGYKTGYAIGPWQKHLNIIGIGACSIGNVKNNWYLNEPDIQKYMRIVESGKLPYCMGNNITKADELRRTMILGTKVCKISREEYIKCYGIDFAKIFAKEIKWLEDNELANLTEDNLEVIGPKGWYYLDNISKCFFEDKYKRYPQPINSNISNLMKGLNKKSRGK